MNKKNLIFFAGAIVAVYSVVIFLIPGFITDDYYIFTYIKNYSNLPIALNPKIEFFLFYRPFSFFSFWIDYNLFQTNSILMKFHSLIFFAGSSTLILLVIKKLSEKLNWGLSPLIIFLFAGIFVLHFDNFTSVFWISDRTEILAFFFYVSAIYYFLKIEDHSDKKYKIFITILFICSFLSKQSSLHLPFILIVLEWVINNKNINRSIRLYIPQIILMVIFTLINLYSNSNQSLEILTQFWKKPFSFLGILGYSFNNYLGDIIYNFFLFHKKFAILLGGFGLAFGIFLIIKKMRRDLIKRLIPFLILLVISAFPRLYVVGGRRLNTIQIFLLIVFFAAFIGYLKNNNKIKILRVFIYFWFAGTIITTVFDIQREIIIQKLTAERISQFNTLFKQYPEVKILEINDIMLLPYQSYFYDNMIFGKYQMDKNTFHFGAINYSNDSVKEVKVKAALVGNLIILNSNSENIILNYDQKYDEKYILSHKNNTAGRFGYSQIVIDYKKLNPMNKKIIYYNGEQWLFLN